MTYKFWSRINPIRPYHTKIKALSGGGSLTRKVTTSAATGDYLLPSSKGPRKEFTIISTTGTATATVTSPDTIVGLTTVAVNTSGTFRALNGVWYRVAT